MPLNDSSSEYVVQTIKHFFNNAIIVQYSITNTLEDQILSKIKLKITNVDSKDNLEIVSVASLPNDEKIKYGEKKYVYAVFSKTNSQTPFPLAKI